MIEHAIDYDDRPPEPDDNDDPRDPDREQLKIDRQLHEAEVDERRDIR
jgi:hypothetical protein